MAAVFSADWTLLPAATGQVPPAAIYSSERLLLMADRLLAVNADFHHFTFRGISHPLLGDLIHHIVDSGRPAGLSLVLDGTGQPRNWEKVLQKLPPNSIELRICHFDGDYSRLLTLIGMAAERGQKARVEIASAAYAKLGTILGKFRRTVPFEYTGNDRDWPAAVKEGPKALPDWPEPALPRSASPGFCIQGATWIRIEPDGSHFAVPCARAVNLGPLWRQAAIAPVIVACRDQECLFRQVLPAFATRAEAEAWLGAPEKPDFDDPVLKVLLRLERLEPRKGARPQQTQIPEPGFIAANLNDIARIWSNLVDEESRDAFLRAVKFRETGERRWLLASPFAKGRHPCVTPEPDDMPFSEKGRFCDFISCKQGLADLKGTIRQHKPMLALPLDSEESLSGPLWLLEQGYELYWAWHGGQPFIYGRNPDHEKPAWAPIQPGLASVIIPCHDNADTIQRCMDSALVQDWPALEIIVVDDASKDATPDILAQYMELWPGVIRFTRLPENQGPGAARNFGLAQARGEFVTFIDADDALPPGVLRAGAEILAEGQADIAAFDLLLLRKDATPELWGVEPGEFAGEASLEHMLLKKSGGYAGYGRIYRGEFLRANNIRYGHTRVHQDIFFSIRAFFYSRRTVVVPQIGYLRFLRPDSHAMKFHGSRHFEACADFAAFAAQFFEDHGLSQQSEAWQYLMRRVYTWDRPRLMQAIREEGQNLADESFCRLASARPMLEFLLQDYAAAYMQGRELPEVLPEDLDWKKEAAKPWPDPVCAVVAPAQEGPVPILSVIMPCYNALPGLPDTLRSVLEQSFRNFELLIIDDASTDGSWEELQDFAAVDERIRLFRMAQNCRQGVCRNIGLEYARGEYIVFVDADDILLPGALAAGIKAIREVDADLVIQAAEKQMKDGRLWRRPHLEAGILNQQQALDAFFRSAIHPEVWAKVYRADILKGCRFPEHVYHQDVPFVLSALRAAQRIAINPFLAVRYIASSNSSMRPKNPRYLHFHSAWRFYGFVEKALKSAGVTGIPFLKSNLENIVLPKVAAFAASGAGLPMTDGDYDLLKNNVPFLKGLMKEMANACTGSRLPLSGCRQRTRLAWQPCLADEPAISVIMAVYNQEKLLPRAVDSVLNQSFSDFELILIDDASRDNSWRICEEYAGRDERVRIFRNEENHGLGFCRNLGLEKACGRYVIHADSDGICAPDYFLAGASWLERLPEVDFVQFAMASRPDFGGVYRAFEKPMIVSGREMLDWYADSKIYYHEMHTKVWRREFIADLYLPEFMYEDTPFVLQAYARAKKIVIDPRVGYAYIQTEHSASAMEPVTYMPRHFEGHIELYAWLEQFFARHPELGPYTGPKVIRRFMDNMRRGILPYVASFARSPVSPLTTRLLACLRSSPFALSNILAEAAGWKKRGGRRQEEWRRSPTGLLCLQKGRVEEPFISLIWHSDKWDEEPSGLPGYEIIAVDDCSGQPLRPAAEISLYQTPWRTGFGPACNLALASARGRYALFWHGPKPPDAAILQKIRLILANKSADIVVMGAEVNEQDPAASLVRGRGAMIFAFRRDFLRADFGNWPGPLEAFVLKALSSGASSACVWLERVPAMRLEEPPVGVGLIEARLAEIEACMAAANDERDVADWLFRPERRLLEDILASIAAALAKDADWRLPENDLARMTASDAISRRLLLELALMQPAKAAKK